MKSMADLCWSLYLTSVFNVNQMWRMTFSSSLSSATDGCWPGASWLPGNPVRLAGLSLCLTSGTLSSSFFFFFFNAVINHAHSGGRGQSPPLKAGELRRTQRALCAGRKHRSLSAATPGSVGETWGPSLCGVFWQPRLGFRKPHVCLISYFISWPGYQDYTGLI